MCGCRRKAGKEGRESGEKSPEIPLASVTVVVERGGREERWRERKVRKMGSLIIK